MFLREKAELDLQRFLERRGRQDGDGEPDGDVIANMAAEGRLQYAVIVEMAVEGRLQLQHVSGGPSFSLANQFSQQTSGNRVACESTLSAHARKTVK